ncbi:PLP-dependent aminotransferase family protein [Aestuariibius sp. HNIBRBA575]|uniref:aminotransferase-like domain-containing protein n=1 Tax=Aestuariibius sp. HNIBRBA575 TaxID=3233343 RepID=UPI0034A541E4
MGTNWHPDFQKEKGAKYNVLVQSIRGAIRSRDLKQGEKLPPVREMAWSLGVTPGTVARAYKMATEEGLLETTIGRGTFVSGTPVQVMDSEPPLSPPSINDGYGFRSCKVPNLGQDRAIRAAMMTISQREQSNFVDCPDEFSDLHVREALVNWVDHGRHGRVSSDDFVLTLGAQNATLIALKSILTGPSPVILTEELAYPGVRLAARMLRAQLVGVKMDEEGIRPDNLEEMLRRHGGQALITAAEVHSPTTIQTSPKRRQEITEIARAYNLQIIEDDCHCIARPNRVSYRALAPERAWFASSLTKSFSAALRFGYLICPSQNARAARLVAQSSFYGLPSPMVDLWAELLNNGDIEKYRQMIEDSIEARVQMAVNILGQWELRWRPDVPFIWLKMPRGWRGSSFAVACEGIGIRIKPADEFALPDGAAPHAVRVALNECLSAKEREEALLKMRTLLENPPIYEGL